MFNPTLNIAYASKQDIVTYLLSQNLMAKPVSYCETSRLSERRSTHVMLFLQTNFGLSYFPDVVPVVSNTFRLP